MDENSFRNKSKIGEIACRKATEYLLAEGYWVHDVELDEEYFSQDIDLLIYKEELGEQSVEVKGDKYPIKNFFLETIANTTKNTPGCILITQSDYLFYVFNNENRLYIFETEKLQLWLRFNYPRLEKRYPETRGENGEYYYSTEGCLAPVNEVVQALNPIIVNLNDYNIQ